MMNGTEVHPPDAARRPTLARGPWLVAGAAAVVAAAIFLPATRGTPTRSPADAGEPPVVGATKLVRATVARPLTFDSELRPFQEVALHAKVAGYVASIDVDIGDAVRAGQVIAQLELPETQDDLERATASQRRAEEEIKRAEAAYDEAKGVLDRLLAVEHTNPKLIAQQDIDSAMSRAKSAAANLAAARQQALAAEAEVKKFRTLLEYARITAPFDGIVTERYADKGALIQAGTSSSTQALPLIRLSDNHRLRLVFPVSVSSVANVRTGAAVRIEIPALKKSLISQVTRTSQRVTTSTRTMDAEVDVPNDDGRLIPGMYAAVRLDVDTRTNALVVPIQALSRGRGASVLVIRPDGTLEERKLVLGVEGPDTVEVLQGVTEGELVMVGNRSQVHPGEKVTPKLLSLETSTPERL